jgi:hypothetical protein
MTAGEDQSELVIGKGFDFWFSIVFCRVQGRSLGIFLRSFAVAAKGVDRPVASRRDNPACGRRRDTFLGPLLKGDEEGVLDGLLGKLDIAKGTDEGGPGLPGLFSKDTFDLSVAGPRQVQSFGSSLTWAEARHKVMISFPEPAPYRFSCRLYEICPPISTGFSKTISRRHPR